MGSHKIKIQCTCEAGLYQMMNHKMMNYESTTMKTPGKNGFKIVPRKLPLVHATAWLTSLPLV